MLLHYTACCGHFISILYAILLATLPFLNKPLFANVPMSEFELFIYCWCAVLLNEDTSLTIHHIMHIWSSQFKENSSCHSRANPWYKDTFHCPRLSQNTSTFYQQSPRALLPSLKMHKLIQITVKTRTHVHGLFFPAFVDLQRNISNLFPPPKKMSSLLAKSLWYLSSLFLQLILTRSGKLSHLPLCFGWVPAKVKNWTCIKNSSL